MGGGESGAGARDRGDERASRIVRLMGRPVAAGWTGPDGPQVTGCCGRRPPWRTGTGRVGPTGLLQDPDRGLEEQARERDQHPAQEAQDQRPRPCATHGTRVRAEADRPGDLERPADQPDRGESDPRTRRRPRPRWRRAGSWPTGFGRRPGGRAGERATATSRCSVPGDWSTDGVEGAGRAVLPRRLGTQVEDGSSLSVRPRRTWPRRPRPRRRAGSPGGRCSQGAGDRRRRAGSPCPCISGRGPGRRRLP